MLSEEELKKYLEIGRKLKEKGVKIDPSKIRKKVKKLKEEQLKKQKKP